MSDSVRSIEQIVDGRAVDVVFQPLVELMSGRVVGYEALARGPKGSRWEDPQSLFAAAAEAGRLGELDWVCRAAAYRAALEAGLAPGVSLFVNVEPEALGSPCPPDLRELVSRAERTLRVISEMTERHLTRDPSALLAAVAHARGVGWGIALDEVGLEPASLALMPFVHPDVIRLHRQLVQEPASPRVAGVASAIMAQAERTGALVLAEGVETDAQRRRALALGATLGQGWLFGRPGPLPTDTRRPPRVVRLLDAPTLPRGTTPYDLVAGRKDLRVATKSLLVSLTRHLEERAADPVEPPVVLSTFQDVQHFTPRSAGGYARLARTSALVAALGSRMGASPVGRVRGADLRVGDPLTREWDVLVVGPHYAAGLIAQDLGDGGPDADRRFSYLVTHDRDVVLQSARALMLHVVRS